MGIRWPVYRTAVLINWWSATLCWLANSGFFMWDIFEDYSEGLRDFSFSLSRRKLLVVKLGEQTLDCAAQTDVELRVCSANWELPRGTVCSGEP